VTCEATRAPLTDMGWTCTGEDLVIILPASGSLPPVVCPIWALAHLFRTSVATAELITEPFRGGDHLHVVIG
jgi:hypothetical protein